MVPKIFKRMKLPIGSKNEVCPENGTASSAAYCADKKSNHRQCCAQLLFDAGDDIDALMVLCRADITSKNEAKGQALPRQL